MAGSVPNPHQVREAGADYRVQVLRGQNHGLFLDMSAGRRWVRDFSAEVPGAGRARRAGAELVCLHLRVQRVCAAGRGGAGGQYRHGAQHAGHGAAEPSAEQRKGLNRSTRRVHHLGQIARHWPV